MVAPSEPTASPPADDAVLVRLDQVRLIFIASDGSLNYVDEDNWLGDDLSQRDKHILSALLSIVSRKAARALGNV